MTSKIRIGIVPEHFSTPIHFAYSKGFFKSEGLNDIEFVSFPSGSGHLIESLKNNEIDYAVGLTEAFVSGALNGKNWYKIVGTYVESPLCWTISTGGTRKDINSIQDIKGKPIGISRYGSGSHIMSYVLALENKWDISPGSMDFVVLNNFANLRKSVSEQEKTTAAFMWERFTSKKYLDSGEIKEIGEIYTPWPSWVIVKRNNPNELNGEKTNNSLFKAINDGIKYFNLHHDEAVEYIHNNLDYSEQDSRKWLETVTFKQDVKGVSADMINNTAKILKLAGVSQTDKVPEDSVYII